jgi:hypothetical protein
MGHDRELSALCKHMHSEFADKPGFGYWLTVVS